MKRFHIWGLRSPYNQRTVRIFSPISKLITTFFSKACQHLISLVYHDPATLRTLLTNHDALARSQTFATTSFTCVLCMDLKKGTACVRLPSCDHVFCVPCLSGYFGMLIREGMVMQVRCPDLNCSRNARVARGESDEEPRTLTQQEVVPIVGPELAERFTRLMIKQRNELDPMVTFCPRLQCQQAVRKDPDNPKLCVCEACGFAFCLFCEYFAYLERGKRRDD